MGSMLFALKALFNKITEMFPQRSITGAPFAARDRKPCCLHFLEKNRQPKHLMADILNRQVKGTGADATVCTTTIEAEEVQIPKRNVDMYALGFPCTPRSLRGYGGGFEDPNCKPFWAGLSTIVRALPSTFVMENAWG